MSARKLVLTFLVLILTFGLAADSFADISNAAVLFLRIAPGSRAAGMGEAFVAIADDATATHWNPAGLGNYPLSDSWIKANIPLAYRPLKDIAPISTGGTGYYLDYDVWALTEAGLIRYDNKSWYTEEVFSTRTDETVRQKVQAYFNITDAEAITRMAKRVARANNAGSYEALQALRDEILARVPTDYSDREALGKDLDSLMLCYDLCRINWDRLGEVRKTLAKSDSASLLSENQSEKIRFAVERSRKRFLPEELKVPYDALFAGELTAISSNGEMLVVGSQDGLARYNGSNWRVMPLAEKMGTNKVTSLHNAGSSILVGTDNGMAVFSGITLARLTTAENALPAGEIQAIGGLNLSDIYAVVNDDLYHYNGRQWSNKTIYTVAIDDSIERIAGRFSLYGTSIERQMFVEKFRQMRLGPAVNVTEEPAPESADETALDETVAEVSVATESDPDASAPDKSDPDTSVAQDGSAAGDDSLKPGDVIEIPLLAAIKGKVNAIHVDESGQIFLATDYGVFYRSSNGWKAPGYRDRAIADGETLENLAEMKGSVGSDRFDSYLALIKDFNDLGASPLESGQILRVPSNPAAAKTTKITAGDKAILFATEEGLIEFDGSIWSRSNMEDFAGIETVGLAVIGGNVWIASDQKLALKGRGRSEITLTHVNWLPELADDLYYEFLSFVTQKEGWGTFGGSVTYISYGKFARTANSPEVIGEFESFDISFAVSYGAPVTQKLKGGITAKFIMSNLSDQGAGAERGSGTSTGFAIDVGLLYLISPRLTFGMAVTNLGPEMAYIDAAQSDDLPRNLAMGFAYKLLQSDYNKLIITAEMNKMLVGFDDSVKEELRQTVFNGGLEYTYARLISARAGYIYDQEGAIKTATLGFGVSLFNRLKFDFSYIPSQENFSLANTMRISLGVML